MASATTTRKGVAVADLVAYEALFMADLADLPGVARLTSQFTVKAVKPVGRLPVGPGGGGGPD